MKKKEGSITSKGGYKMLLPITFNDIRDNKV
jgi:hypothetical protein